MVNICFSTTNKLFSRVLRWFMSSRVSHVLVTYHNPVFDRVMVLEAQGRGFVSVSWKRWRKKNRLIARYSLRLPDDRVRDGLRFLSSRLGDEFDTRALFGFLLRPYVRRNFLDSPKKLFCSEAVAEFLRVVGVKLPREPSAITPKELFYFVRDNPELFCLEEHTDRRQKQRELLAAASLEQPRPPSRAQVVEPPTPPRAEAREAAETRSRAA